MRSIQLVTGTLAVVATSSLIGLGNAAVATESTTPTVTHERGTVLECGGTWKGRDVYTLVYENSNAGNTVQVVIGDGEHGAGRDTKRDLVDGRHVRASVRLDGSRALVAGTARKVGKATPVHEVLEDAGQTIVSDGHHRRLATDLTLSWRGTTVPLDCGDSFAYVLTVTRTPVE